jgi:hypothetical protein
MGSAECVNTLSRGAPAWQPAHGATPTPSATTLVPYASYQYQLAASEPAVTLRPTANPEIAPPEYSSFTDAAPIG